MQVINENEILLEGIPEYGSHIISKNTNGLGGEIYFNPKYIDFFGGDINRIIEKRDENKAKKRYELNASNVYTFNRDNLLEYLESVKDEYVYHRMNSYKQYTSNKDSWKSVNLYGWEKRKEFIKNHDNSLEFEMYLKVSTKNRSFIGCNKSDIYSYVMAYTLIPVNTNLRIVKTKLNGSCSKYEFLLEYIPIEDVRKEIQFTVYTKKQFNNNIVCYLCGCSLENYIKNIPQKYKDNPIQRGLVKNVYLDRLMATIIDNDNIPTITLVSNEIQEQENAILLKNYKILDGLQRTFRLKEIWNSIEIFMNIDNKEELKTLSNMALSKEYGEILRDKDCDITIFRNIVKEYNEKGNLNRITEYFSNNIQWFEIWENLSIEEETNKMLVLNAGHKAMDIRHQLELLFLNVLPNLDKLCEQNGGIGIVRNKDKSDTTYSRDRKKGEYYFPHLISSILSYQLKKPVTTNAELISKLQQEDNAELININYNLLVEVIEFLLKIDDFLEKKYGIIGTKWISKETVLVGMFAAVGQYELNSKIINGFEKLLRVLNEKKDILRLENYESDKNTTVEISKVNLGNITKNAVQTAIYSILISEQPDEINWNYYFGGK